jgi:cell division protein ZapA (FtsZ GTPase activity inhibitor)
MMKILRKARLHLLNSSKIRSYFLYATGEIILVVLGILIALQINKWNEDYKDKQLEQVYYCKFLEDINQDRQLLERLITDNASRIKSNNELIHLLQQDKPSRKEVIKSLREVITKMRFRFRPSPYAFDDLKSSGKLTILKDLTLKKKLLNYYAIMESYGDISDIVADASITLYNNPTKDFNEIGFQDIYYIKGVLDSTLVDTDKLKTTIYPSPQIRKLLLSDAIFHLNTNARKKELYKTMADEILSIQSILSSKCAQ